jgi:phospholipase C
VWKKTIFILTYDENDGYFDHAPSFVAAGPKRPETGRASDGVDTGLEYTYAEDELQQGVSRKDARSGPIGMGFRVPMIIASPWSRGGWVNSQLFDHTSTLIFLEYFVERSTAKPCGRKYQRVAPLCLGQSNFCLPSSQREGTRSQSSIVRSSSITFGAPKCW